MLFPQSNAQNIRKDVVIILATTFCFFFFAASFDIAEYIVVHLDALEALELDEIILTFAFSTIVLAVYAVKWWRDYVSLKAQKEEYVKLDGMKTQLIGTAAHEIRTPLTSIKGYTEMILEDFESNNCDNMKRYFEVIEKNVERLQHLTDNLLNIQRLEGEKVTLEKEIVDLGDVMQRAVLEIKPIVDKKRQTLVFHGVEKDALVFIDVLRITEVLTNLISNASRYSREGSKIDVYIESEDDEYIVRVVDQGAGIRKEDLPKLFLPFPQIDHREYQSGMGLGLSICKDLIDLHGERIWASSDGEGQGSVFSFTLRKYEK